VNVRNNFAGNSQTTNNAIMQRRVLRITLGACIAKWLVAVICSCFCWIEQFAALSLFPLKISVQRARPKLASQSATNGGHVIAVTARTATVNSWSVSEEHKEERNTEPSSQDWLASWRKKRLTAMSEGLDWSRCFISVLLVDSPSEPAYLRARLAQRLLDAIAEWNGLGKVIEVFSCTPQTEEEEDKIKWNQESSGRDFLAGAIKEFARNVGLHRSEVDQILRKLGFGWHARLLEEDLRQHDVIIALDRAAQHAAAKEMRVQGVGDPTSNLLLLSDFVWLIDSNRSLVGNTKCVDGSGTGFVDEDMERALSRCCFEESSEACLETQGRPPSTQDDALLASVALDIPCWPHKTLAKDSSPGKWRRLHCSLLRGSVGLAWFLVDSWQDKYCNPLQHRRAHPQP